MNIILIGFMGTGKSSVGMAVAKELGWTYLDTDEQIEKQENMPINDIFSIKGEAVFRDLETQLLGSFSQKDQLVLSTGGGMVLRDENVASMKKMGKLVLLTAKPEVVYERIKQETHRPLLKVADPLEEIRKILGVRQPIYKKVADLEIDTSKLGVAQVAQKIVKYINEQN